METPQKLAFLLYVFCVLLCVLSTAGVPCELANFTKYELSQGVTTESIAFRGRKFSEGPFVAASDGRILKWQGSSIGFGDFAYTSPTRTKQLCDGTTNPDLGPICGTPLDLTFQPKTGLFYIADAYKGLEVVGPNGGLSTQLVGGFRFLSGIDVDMLSGCVYIQEASTTFEYRDTLRPGFQPGSTGRFSVYNPLTRKVTLLLSGLAGGGGPAVSRDSTFVLVPEFDGMRILKYWLVGPKAHTAEVLLNISGKPNIITRAERFGEFWVDVSVGFYFGSPLVTPLGIRFNSNGEVLQTVSFAKQFFNISVSEVIEQGGKLYVGSAQASFIGVYSNYSI